MVPLENSKVIFINSRRADLVKCLSMGFFSIEVGKSRAEKCLFDEKHDIETFYYKNLIN